jgi:DNA segregation ATPase FtsK/SpoIIIE-like protein
VVLGQWPWKTISVKVTADYTTAEELEAIIRSIPPWDAYTVKSISDADAHKKLRDTLSRHHFPIPGVNISGTTGIIGHGSFLHWLVVTGLSAEYQWNQGESWRWVRVYNPFNNQNEFYMWERFKKAWGGGNWGTGKWW